jgi:Ca2+-binding EF-hand superfamily protein
LFFFQCAEFSEFLHLIALQKQTEELTGDESDILDAFVAMGGNGDATGEISARLLRETIHTFGLTVDIDQLIREADTDASGFIDYEEFRAMLRG